MNAVVFETDRLLICEPCMDDVDVFAAMWADAETMKYVGGDGLGWTHDRVFRWMERQVESHKSHQMAQWTIVLKDTKEVIGQGGLEPIEFNGREIELAYQFGNKHWGKGYASELAIACAAYGCESLNIHRYVAMSYPENTASVRVLEKVGFHFIGMSDLYYDTMLNVYELNEPIED